MDWEVFAKLQEVADDGELSVLTNLAIRAGVFWDCRECGFTNPVGETCDGCGGSE